MKLVIPVKYHNQKCKITRAGNWFDLRADEGCVLNPGDFKLISLGLSMNLSPYIEANVVPRSGSFKNFGIIQTNHYGVIDAPDMFNEGYVGNNDIWKFGAYALKLGTIAEGDRICQFRFNIVQDAPWYIKLWWLFISEIEFMEVDSFDNKDRGGFGSTGVK